MFSYGWISWLVRLNASKVAFVKADIKGIGAGVPVFDISDHYAEDDIRDLLVRNTNLGAALAGCLSGSKNHNGATPEEEGDSEKAELEYPVVLMRGHGMTVASSSIEQCVQRAIYTAENASIQTASLTTHRAYFDSRGRSGEIQYLRPDEWEPTTDMVRWSFLRPWNLWLRQVESSTFYVNNAANTEE